MGINGKKKINKYRVILSNLANALQTPFPFYGTQLINPFLSSLISANHDKVEEFQLILKSVYPSLFEYKNRGEFTAEITFDFLGQIIFILATIFIAL